MKKPAVSALPFDRKTLQAQSGLPAESGVLSLNETIENSRSLCGRLCGPRARLKFRLQPGLDHALNGVVDLNQIIIDLLLMAANTMPFGGSITVSTSNVKCSKDLLGHGQYVRFLIEIQRSASDGTPPIWMLGRDEAQSLRALVRAKVAECQGWFVECQETEHRFLMELLLPSVSRSDAEARATAA